MALVDTSVLVAYLCPEPLHARATRMLNRASLRVVTPLIQVELASALAIKTRTGQADVASAQAVLAQYRRLIDAGLIVVREVAAEDYRQAYDWLATFATPLRTADAVHLACAFNQGETLLTADQSLAYAGDALRVPCRLLQ